MRYLIDGYNLLHALGLLCGKVGPHGLHKARLTLLGQLCDRHGTDAVDVTVVFDASRAPPGAVPEEYYRGIHIWYALQGEADDVIEDLIQRDAAPQQLTVVSDDHRIQHAARRRRCPMFGCMDYLDRMERLRRPKAAVEDASAKPESVSDDETRHWLREFADLVDDPKWREELGPNFGDDKTNENEGT